MKSFFTIVLAFATPTLLMAQASKLFTISNPSNWERKDELIVLKKLFILSKLNKKTTSPYYIIKSSKNMPQVVQFDDMDGDGKWDEAVFLTTLQPKQKLTFTIIESNKPMTIKAMVRAHVRQVHKLPDETFGASVMKDTMPYNNQPTDFAKQKLPSYLTEGPAWENDKVGFRKYFDVRNANDIWGKTTNRMVLDEVGVNPDVIYHHFDSTWGMDILKVGKSLGAGGLALQVKIDGKDSLVRFGSNVAQTTYEQVADGPIRAIFRIKYKGWIIGNLKPIDAIEEISIWGGQYFFENKVTMKGVPAGAKLITGINDFYTPKSYEVVNQKVHGIYTYGVQSENKDNLGLAVLVPSKTFWQTGKASELGDVKNTFTIGQAIDGNSPVVYRFVSAWEASDKIFSSKQSFAAYLKSEAMKFGERVVVD